MNSEWCGDSFDIVKRFFVAVLQGAGYRVYMNAMFTGRWNGKEKVFHRFVGASTPSPNALPSREKSALLIDPDTGIGKIESPKHVTVETIVCNLEHHDIVFSFDQSFSRNRAPLDQMKEKLEILSKNGALGFYYDSHARFLFAAKSPTIICAVRDAILATGLPQKRLITK
jgi:hypothetical protein